jgi:ADP-ribose pyrophosphatase YjhB (NUDIX family)
LPAGFMENSETTAEAAVRETEEEAGANIEIGDLFSLLNVAQVHQVHLFYLARLRDLDFAPGIESLEVKLFSENEIPWDDLAFPTIRTTLELFYADCVKIRESGGGFGFHSQDIVRPMRISSPPNDS